MKELSAADEARRTSASATRPPYLLFAWLLLDALGVAIVLLLASEPESIGSAVAYGLMAAAGSGLFADLAWPIHCVEAG